VDKLESFLGEEQTPEAFWQAVKTNLQAGRIRLLFVADQIPSELRRIIEFLNRQMDPAEVLAVEIRQYVGQGLKTLVPRVMGQTAEAEQKKGIKGREWDLDTFLRVIHKNCGKEIAALAQDIYKWADHEFGEVSFGPQSGAFGPVIVPEISEAALFVVRTDGRITMRFRNIKTRKGLRPESQILKEFIDRLGKIPSFDFTEKDLEGKPKRALDPLLTPSHLKLFQNAVLWLRDQLRRE
jgi:hypothetical protein